MKKVKYIAGTLALTMGLTMVSPVWAAQEGVSGPTMTLEQVQDAVVKNNKNKTKMELNLDILETNQMIIRNAQKSLNNTLNGMGNQDYNLRLDIAGLEQDIRDLEAILADPAVSEEVKADAAALIPVKQMAIEQLRAQRSGIDSTAESLQDQYDSLKDQLTDLEDTEDDLKKTLEDFELEMRQVAGLLVINVIKMEENIELMEQSHQMSLKMKELEELKNQLGLSLDLDVTTKVIETAQSRKQIDQLKQTVDLMKRQINDLMGRTIDAPIEFAPVDLPTVIAPAPPFDQTLVNQVLEESTKRKQLERDLKNLEEDKKDAKDSNAEKIADKNIKLKQLEIQEYKTTTYNDVKAKIEEIDKAGKTYKEAKMVYEKEAKKLEQAKLKQDLGMISAIEYQGAELALKQAEIDHLNAGYGYYLVQQEFECMKKGIDLSSYYMMKM